jgi:HPt (histidine-containing phosphotransfer) domain-containing protein
MALEVPNTHPLLDRAWGEAQVADHYSSQIELGRELAEYAANLLLRGLESAPDDIPNHMVLSVLFRNAVVAIDGAVSLMTLGALGAAQLQVRALLETRWGLTLALRDPKKWGLHLYISSRRHDLLQARRNIPGTPEHAAYDAAHQLLQSQGAATVFALADAQELAKALERLLSKPEYVAVNDLFERAATAGREQPWYFDGNGTNTIRSLAKRVDGEGDYLSVYQDLSNQVHPGRILAHLRRDDSGYTLAHVRSPEGFRGLFILVLALTADCCRMVIDRYRSGEQDVFFARYVTNWRAQYKNTPEVEIVLNRLAN